MLSQFWELARQNKVYWITPLVFGLLLVVVLVVLALNTPEPFIYKLF